MTSVLVTGATDGLGRVVAADLAARGFSVHVHGRSEERAQAVAEEIGAAGVHLADFSSLAQVRALAEELPHVDVLVNNAGLISERRVVTGDGIELTFQVNHLAPFLLTMRLLEHAPPRRVVHVASLGQERPDFGDLMLEHGYDEWRAYRQSKLAQIMFSFECARRVALQQPRREQERRQVVDLEGQLDPVAGDEDGGHGQPRSSRTRFGSDSTIRS